MIDWKRVLYLTRVSRFLDDTEENRLVPEKKVLYQFSARGHEVAQIILGQHLTHPHDAVSAYYRSRPLLLSLRLSIADAFAGPMGKSGGFSDGRDIGVVCNLPNDPGPVVLPMSGDVGSQYTPAAGWAQAITYHRSVLGDAAYDGALACVTGGEASVATNGFWSAITIATTLELPMLFFIEDNGYGISVPGRLQTPGGSIAANLGSFRNLLVRDGDGTDPAETDARIAECVAHAPGGPTHVLLSDREAEHIPGCNMAFRRACLQAVGGFDPQFRTAGDDVDICWQLQQRGWTLGFSPDAPPLPFSLLWVSFVHGNNRSDQRVDGSGHPTRWPRLCVGRLAGNKGRNRHQIRRRVRRVRRLRTGPLCTGAKPGSRPK